MLDFFRDMDADSSGELTKKEFGKAIRKLGFLNATKAQIDEVFYGAIHNSGVVDYIEMDKKLRSLKGERPPPPPEPEVEVGSRRATETVRAMAATAAMAATVRAMAACLLRNRARGQARRAPAAIRIVAHTFSTLLATTQRTYGGIVKGPCLVASSRRAMASWRHASTSA